MACVSKVIKHWDYSSESAQANRMPEWVALGNSNGLYGDIDSTNYSNSADTEIQWWLAIRWDVPDTLWDT